MFAPASPPAINPVAQRLKGISETNDDGEGLVWVALQKRNVVAPDEPVPN